MRTSGEPREPSTQYMVGGVVTSIPPAEWEMYDVPLTFSIAAPCAAAAEEYARQWVESDMCSLYRSGTPCYDRDHIFVDGDARECDCLGH